MKKKSFVLSAFLLMTASVVSCKSNKDSDSVTLNDNTIIDGNFISKEAQGKLTPDMVYDILKKRNLEYMQDNLTVRNTSERIRKASLGQNPAAVVLSCLDSRVPVEDVFHSGIGDLFVARVAGNISNEDILGSMEFACKVSGAKLIVVLGHEHCGAVKSAIDNVELGNITTLLNKIKLAIANVKDFKGEKSSKNHEFVEAVTKANVLETIANIRKNSPILKEMEDKGEIKIVGGEYHMETGNVEFLNQ